ncbi:MAG TPA: V-type ATP synthase subunit E [Candidatus Enterenecus stercoripullorum]|nr:V-type ATP synthase subunit E [Candidatus Enterenecus stercoripullorum]
MNGMDKIIGRIYADARAEAEHILAQARDQEREIKAQYAVQAQREAQAILEIGRRGAAQREEQLDSAACLECRKAVLEAKQEMVEEAFRLALKKLREMPREDYVALLARLAAKASSTGREALIFSPADRKSVGRAVVLAANRILKGGKLTLSEEYRSMEGGFVLSGGAVEVNCGFEAMLRAKRERLTGAVAGVLFPETGREREA